MKRNTSESEIFEIPTFAAVKGLDRKNKVLII